MPKEQAGTKDLTSAEMNPAFGFRLTDFRLSLIANDLQQSNQDFRLSLNALLVILLTVLLVP